MELQSSSLVCVGDSAMPFIIVGAIILAIVMLIIAFALMNRKK